MQFIEYKDICPPKMLQVESTVSFGSEKIQSPFQAATECWLDDAGARAGCDIISDQVGLLLDGEYQLLIL